MISKGLQKRLWTSCMKLLCKLLSKRVFVILVTTILIFIFLSLWQVGRQMIFIGDQAWFYLSAKDLLLGRDFPLVGITSSHTWLHQGALWTYLLSIAIWLFGYDPVAGVYLSIFIGILTILSFYFLVKNIFSERVGILTAVLYALSPLTIIATKMPYHTTPITLVVLWLLFCLTKWVKGQKNYFYFLFLLLGILYSLELASVSLLSLILLVFLYGFLRKSRFVTRLSMKEVIFSLSLGIIPLIPVFVYDLSHGFQQTVIYAAWIVYKIVVSLLRLLYPNQAFHLVEPSFTLNYFSRLFPIPGFFSMAVIILSQAWTMLTILRKFIKKQKIDIGLALICIWFWLFFVIYFMNDTNSEAYFPLVFPAIFIVLAKAVDRLLSNYSKISLSVLVVFLVLNIYYSLRVAGGHALPGTISLSDREEAVSYILNTAGGRGFEIKGAGNGSQYMSFTMPYEYLLWLRGEDLSKESSLVFTLLEQGGKIEVIGND